MKETPLAAVETLRMLRENASLVAELVRGLPAERLHAAPQPDEWSPNEVLAHMRACGDVWGGNIARIIAEAHPTFPGTNPRTWMKKTDYPAWRFDEALRAYSKQREEILSTLEALPPDDWERTATVTAYGQANERTLRSYASLLAKHERPHVRQIERALG